MIQAYKRKVRYWFAVKFGELQTGYEENVCEIICPDCGMKTAINATKNTTQSCYFCDGDLISTHQTDETEISTSNVNPKTHDHSHSSNPQIQTSEMKINS